MTEEELDWFEENWNKGKNGRKAESHRRVWKLTDNIYDEPYEGRMSNPNFRNQKCWKKKRKTHYLIKKVHEPKKRKPKEREHWRYKKPYHGYGYTTVAYKRWGDKQPKYLEWDEVYSNLGFLESLNVGDYLRKPNNYYNGDKFYRVREKDYTDYGDEFSLYITCTDHSFSKYDNVYWSSERYIWRKFLKNEWNRFYRKVYSKKDYQDWLDSKRKL